MEEKLQHFHLRRLLTGKLDELIATVALLFFLCSDAIDITIKTIIPSMGTVITVAESIFLFFLIIAYYTQYFVGGIRRKTRVWIIYSIAILFIVISVFAHPEYSGWFNHERYGILNTFSQLTAGFYALLIFGMVTDKQRIISCLIYSNRFNFAFYVVQFVRAMQRGYWVGYSSSGELSRMSYSLVFGYNVAICAIIGIVLFLLNKKYIDLGIFIVSVVMILLQGSRGALLCIVLAIALIEIYKWKALKHVSSKKYYAVLITLTITIIALVLGWSVINRIMIKALSALHINSRSINMLLEGSLADENGRDRIRAVSINMIRDGGVFGYGFYGDRFVIGQRWSYGYPHNLLLEVLIQFGVPLGSIILIIFVWSIVRMGLSITDTSWQFLFVVLLSSNAKLLLSDSFWYYWPFWAFLAVICNWRQQEMRRKLSFQLAGRQWI